MGFLSTLLYILLGFYVFKWLLRLFAPKIMAFALKRLQKKMNDSFTGFTENQGAAPQQDTSKKPPIAKEKTTVGEYIDFEEIE
jgi:hypothetical protein